MDSCRDGNRAAMTLCKKYCMQFSKWNILEIRYLKFPELYHSEISYLKFPELYNSGN